MFCKIPGMALYPTLKNLIIHQSIIFMKGKSTATIITNSIGIAKAVFGVYGFDVTDTPASVPPLDHNFTR